MNAKKKIPINMNEEEEALFWDNHDLLDYIHDTNIAEVSISNALKENIIIRHKNMKKKMTFYVRMNALPNRLNKDCGAKYIYNQTKSIANNNPDLKVNRKESNNYSMGIA